MLRAETLIDALVQIELLLNKHGYSADHQGQLLYPCYDPKTGALNDKYEIHIYPLNSDKETDSDERRGG